ncbi:T7SS effector LXG polymorphic toxin [Streptococcus acidominimus]|uniref:T7SS effector LXG polymorphic toxin n=1 Tax=Streptococcus acidominimus TaxID=1326 RepID=UPI001F56C635|nr:T7SS effector LXG polymorphic toxin [Streptococcus acidominimus]
MSYKIRFDDITSFQTTSQTSIASWGQSIASINTAMSDFINDSSLQGEGIAGIRTYLSEVHGTLLQTLIHLMNDYSSSFLLYKDGYYNIESDHHAEPPEQVFITLQSDLKNSHDRFNHQLELLNAEKDKISDLVSYSGTSHTSTALDYGVLTTKLKTLDNAIQQYESNHARQDLTAFKELVSATKSLLAEYSGQTRKISSYRSGDLGKLQSVERFATAYQQVEQHITNTMDKVQAAQERDRVRFEALAAEERSTKGWIDLALGAVTIAVGVAAIVASGGAATPLVAGAWIAGSGTVAYGLSNTVEAGHNLYLGYRGDGKTHATNPIRDTLFMGNDKTYHQVGGLFTTASAILIPIGKTQSVVKGLTEFTIGEVGGFAGHQAAYHGTKLLGGSEADAQRASFVGSILGGYAASSAASKFTLNDISPSKAKVPEVDRPSYNREQILKNIEDSKLARESSKFDDYLRREYTLNGKYFPERIELPNGQRAYLSADAFEGKAVPVRSRDFVDTKGHIKWPEQGDGFVLDNHGRPITEPADLKAGQLVDRYGSLYGQFTSPIIDGEVTPFNKRGLPYPEGYQPYHRYEVVMDITEENIVKAFKNAPIEVQQDLIDAMNNRGFSFSDLANNNRGEIAKVFGQGGGVQIRFGNSLIYYENLGLIREVK